jgi:hypothetical protein
MKIKSKEKIKSQIMDLFVVPIGLYEYPYHSEWKKVVYEIIEKYSNTKYEMPADQGGIQHFFNSFDQDIFRNVKEPEFQEAIRDFELFTKTCLNSFFVDTFGKAEYNEMLITNSWINVTRKGNWLDQHFHGNCILACNYFVNFTEEHTPLSFCNPFRPNGTHPAFSINTEDHTPYSVPTVATDAKEGNLIVWQSGLYHGFNQIKNDISEERVTLAMNACPDIVTTGPYRIKIGVCDESN